MSPVTFGMKSTRNSSVCSCCRDSRVPVIPSLSLMDMFSSAKVIAAVKTVCLCVSVCGGRQDCRQQGSICSAPLFSSRQKTAGSCERMHQHGDDRQTQRTLRLQPPGRPGHLPHSPPPASGTRPRFSGDSGRALHRGNVQKQII